MDKMVTTAVAADILKVTPARIRQLILANRLKAQKIGRDHLICVNDVREFAASEQKKAGRPKKNEK
jgi:hypothetical protein